MRPLKEKVSLTLDSDLLVKLKVLAEEDERSLSQYINIILKNHITKTENTQDTQSNSKRNG